MPFTLCTSAAAMRKAGEGETISENTTSSAIIQDFSDFAERTLSSEMNIDLIDVYSGLSTNTRAVIDSAVSSLIAMDIISWSIKGYSSIRESELLMDKLDSSYRRDVANLKDQTTKTFIGVF